REIVVVQPGPAQLGVLEGEAERLDQMQVRAGTGGHADRVTRVGGDARCHEDDVEHPPTLSPRPAGVVRSGQRWVLRRSAAACTYSMATTRLALIEMKEPFIRSVSEVTIIVSLLGPSGIRLGSTVHRLPRGCVHRGRRHNEMWPTW